jgi:hypothetical protein
MMLRILFFLALFFIYLYAVIEAAQTRAPNKLPRYAWVLLTMLLPGVGTILWFFFGRRQQRTAAPDDDPRFLRKLDDEVWKRKLREWRKRMNGTEGE